MDIRMINKKDEVINVSSLHLKVINNWLVAMNNEEKAIVIETYENAEEAHEALVHTWEMIEMANKQGLQSITIHT